jgi:hypothetical protein
MRWAGLSLLVGLGVGLSVGLVLGLTLAPARVVTRSDESAPLAPEMSVARFLACSEAAPGPELSEAQWQSLNVQWALRHWRPQGLDWPAP